MLLALERAAQVQQERRWECSEEKDRNLEKVQGWILRRKGLMVMVCLKHHVAPKTKVIMFLRLCLVRAIAMLRPIAPQNS